MCGEIPANCYKVEMTLYVPTNSTSTTIPLPRQLQQVKEIWLDEYVISAPVGGAVWRLGLGFDFPDFVTSNLTGAGYPIFINSSSFTHVAYDNPRVIYTGLKSLVNSIIVTLTSNTNTNQLAPSFTEAAFKVTFVCVDPLWQPDRTVAEGVMAPQRASFPFATKATFM